MSGLSDTAAWAQIVSVGGTSLVFVGTGGWKFVRWLRARLDAQDKILAQLREEQTAQGNRLDQVEAQLKPNGGGSLHDRVSAVAEHQRQDAATVQAAADLASAVKLVLERIPTLPPTTDTQSPK